jgi:hypothetical protein
MKEYHRTNAERGPVVDSRRHVPVKGACAYFKEGQ